MSEDLSNLLNVKDVARMLKVAVRTVWRLRSSQKLPKPVPVGGSVRWRHHEIVAWINQGCPAPAMSPGKRG